MVSVKNFHRSARARPPPADTPDESSAVTTSQVTPLIQDFAVSLPATVTGNTNIICKQMLRRATVKAELTLFCCSESAVYEVLVVPAACQNGAETTDIER
jgi:hypothetical protein